MDQCVGGSILDDTAVRQRARLRAHVFYHHQILHLAHLLDVVGVAAALGIEGLGRVETVVAGHQGAGFDAAGAGAHLGHEIPRDRAAEPHEVRRLPLGQLAQERQRVGRRHLHVLSFTRMELFEPPHTMFAVAALRMHRRIVEEDAVVARFDLQAHDVFLVAPPVRVVHAGGPVIAAVPGGQRVAFGIALQPLDRRCSELRTQLCRPVAVESFQLHDGSGAHITQRQPDAARLGAAARRRRQSCVWPPVLPVPGGPSSRCRQTQWRKLWSNRWQLRPPPARRGSRGDQTHAPRCPPATREEWPLAPAEP